MDTDEMRHPAVVGSVRAPAKLYTEPELAELLGVSVDTVKRQRLDGHVTFTRVGRQVRYSQADVRAYLDARRVDAVASPFRSGRVTRDKRS